MSPFNSIGRRQVLQGLGAVAAASMLPRVPAFAAAAAPLTVKELNHIGLFTSKVNGTRDFYVKLLGLPAETMEDNIRVYVRFPGGFISINKVDNRPAEYNHFCFGIEGFDGKDVPALKAKIEGAGFKTRPSDAVSLNIVDPNGIDVQLGKVGFDGLEGHVKKEGAAPPPPPAGQVKVTELNHIGVSSPKANETRDFYMKAFGVKADTVEDNNRIYVRVPGAFISINNYPNTKAQIHHFAFGIPNFDEGNTKGLIEKLKAAGFDAAPADAVSIFVKDPNGLLVQLGKAGFTGLEDHPIKKG